MFYELLFALLVGDAAAGLASGLARGLALAATAVLCAVAKVAGFNGLNMLHDGYLHRIDIVIIALSAWKVNRATKFLCLTLYGCPHQDSLQAS